jgi:predicted transcriptional regulator
MARPISYARSRLWAVTSESDSAAPLHELEREVMEQLWRLGEANGRELLDAVNAAAARDRAYTTVMTVLGRLQAKGFVSSRRSGRRDMYRPLVEREAWVRERASIDVSRLLADYGDAALVQFARQLEELDDDRREKLKRLADAS